MATSENPDAVGADDKDLAQEQLRAYSSWPGTTWRHYKGGEYRVDSVVVDEETLDLRVNYVSLARGSRWSRRLLNWIEVVVVDGRRSPRFSRNLDAPENHDEVGAG